jgi:2-polyprenyl-6-methoxyphenol hydroxylase-like FAD-dependent oxidoreductase
VGEEYQSRVLRLVVTDRLEDFLPGLGQISYIFDPEGTSISLLKMPDCWRIIIRLPKGYDENEVTKPEWYMRVVRHFMPAVPERLTLRSLDIYGASKMVADEYHRGRVFLAGDATHLSNTRGGMNMNCGIHDAYEMALAIGESIRSGDSGPAEAAAQRRRDVAVNELIPRTDRNVTGGPEWLEHIRATGADPDAARAMLWRTAMLDMAPQPGRIPATAREGVAE